MILGIWPPGVFWRWVLCYFYILGAAGGKTGTDGPIVSCSNAALPSRGYNVPLDRSRGFRRTRHSNDRHTCPLLALDSWIVFDTSVLKDLEPGSAEQSFRTVNCVVLASCPPKISLPPGSLAADTIALIWHLIVAYIPVSFNDSGPFTYGKSYWTVEKLCSGLCAFARSLYELPHSVPFGLLSSG